MADKTMGRELYIAVEYNKMDAVPPEIEDLSPIFVNKNKIRFERLIRRLDGIDQEIFDYLYDSYSANWIMLIDNLKILRETTGRLRVKRKDFMLHINELYKLLKHPPWQLAKKSKSGNSPLLYYESLKEIKTWLDKHETVLFVFLDYWDNTSGYDEYPPFETELNLSIA